MPIEGIQTDNSEEWEDVAAAEWSYRTKPLVVTLILNVLNWLNYRSNS